MRITKACNNSCRLRMTAVQAGDGCASSSLVTLQGKGFSCWVPLELGSWILCCRREQLPFASPVHLSASFSWQHSRHGEHWIVDVRPFPRGVDMAGPSNPHSATATSGVASTRSTPPSFKGSSLLSGEGLAVLLHRKAALSHSGTPSGQPEGTPSHSFVKFNTSGIQIDRHPGPRLICLSFFSSLCWRRHWARWCLRHYL